jgi:hypothetical protein
MIEGAQLYRTLALAEVPRILGMADREEGSPTFGCFDRYYWHYRFLDFPNVRFQEAVVLLALLVRFPFPENRYFDHPAVRRWVLAGIHFWLRSRNRDGSTNEAYPFERGFCPTAMSFWAVTEALRLLGDSPAPGLRTTASWLIRRDNPEVSNQMAAAGAALYNYYLLSGDERSQAAARVKFGRLLGAQDPSGFFPEYGGRDLGYHSLTLSLLARYYKNSKDPAVLVALQRGIAVAEAHVRGNGSFEYDVSTRQTQFLYPYAFALTGSDVVRRHLSGLERDEVIQPGWLDDRYVSPLATDYLMAYLELAGCS